MNYLAFPVIAALVAAVIVSLSLLVPVPAFEQLRLFDAIVAGAAIFFVVLALAHHHAANRMAGRIRERLSGLDSFDADLRRRVARLEETVARIALDGRTAASAGPAPDATAAPTNGNATEADDNIIRFNRDARQRPEPQPSARPAGARLAEALEGNAIQAWFQPIVTLPGRKTRFLEASPYLVSGKDAGRDVARRIEPGYGNSPEVDRRMLLQSLTLLRELDRAERALGVIWPIHLPLLDDFAAFHSVERILETNSAFAQHLVARVDHRDFAGLNNEQTGRLHRIRELGFSLALGNCPVPATDVEPARSGLFKVLFMDAEKLIANWLEIDAPKAGRSAAEIEAEIVASGVATEEQAMALIDQDILLAQGEFFSLPRPLRRSGQAGQAAEN